MQFSYILHDALPCENKNCENFAVRNEAVGNHGKMHHKLGGCGIIHACGHMKVRIQKLILKAIWPYENLHLPNTPLYGTLEVKAVMVILYRVCGNAYTFVVTVFPLTVLVEVEDIDMLPPPPPPKDWNLDKRREKKKSKKERYHYNRSTFTFNTRVSSFSACQNKTPHGQKYDGLLSTSHTSRL